MPYPQNILSVVTLFMRVYVQKVISYSAHGQTTMSPILGEKVRFCARRLLCTQKKAQLFPLLSSFVGSKYRNAAKKKKTAADHFAFIMDTISFFFTFKYLWPLLVKFPKIMQIIFQELIAMQYILPLQYIHVLPLQYIPGHAAHSMLKQQIGSRNSIKIVPTFENSLMQSLLSYFTGNKLRNTS